jgi:hypothetical protein
MSERRKSAAAPRAAAPESVIYDREAMAAILAAAREAKQ